MLTISFMTTTMEVTVEVETITNEVTMATVGEEATTMVAMTTMMSAIGNGREEPAIAAIIATVNQNRCHTTVGQLVRRI